MKNRAPPDLLISCKARLCVLRSGDLPQTFAVSASCIGRPASSAIRILSAVTGARRKISLPTAAAIAFTTAPNPAMLGASPLTGERGGRPLGVVLMSVGSSGEVLARLRDNLGTEWATRV